MNREVFHDLVTAMLQANKDVSGNIFICAHQTRYGNVDGILIFATGDGAEEILRRIPRFDAAVTFKPDSGLGVPQ